MFAVIDIETTGGSPDRDRITEIAILLHDGEKVIKRFSTLINPECRIPSEISRLTGITNEMVEKAPKFYEVAKEIVELTNDAIFVAHNVRFDYGFVKAAFRELGFLYQKQTLCTVRLSRSTFKGLPSYSLGRLCDALDIQIKDRHRALGDAEATAILLDRIIKQKGVPDKDWMNSESKKTSIPPLLPESVIKNIPEGITGVYYFHDSNGYVIYVGKALDIKKRIMQHFSLSSKGSRKSIQMKNQIADISFEPTGDELIALLLESDEIKKIKPIYNVSQKKAGAIPYFGIFNEYDAAGYICFSIRKLKDGDQPLNTADNIATAKDLLHQMLEQHNLCQSKCDLHQMPGPCFHFHLHKCQGACVGKEPANDYNVRALEALKRYSFHQESFLIIGKGRNKDERSVICIEKGHYKGFGYIDTTISEPDLQSCRQSIRSYPHNRDIQQILCTFLKRRHLKMEYQVEELNQAN